MKRAWLLLGLVVSGCALGEDEAVNIFRTEVARDLGGVARDDDDARELGARIHAAADTAPAGEPGIGLADCFRLAIANSEGLRGRAEGVLQADMLEREAIASVLPRVALYGTHVKDDRSIALGGGSSIQPSERTGYGFTVTQSLFEAEVFPRLSIAAETRRIETLLLRNERDQLLFQVATEFYEALGLEADLEAIEATRASAQESLRVLEARRAVGVARADDVLLAQASVAEAEARSIQAAADLERVRARLRNVLGIDRLPPLQDTYEVIPGPRSIPRLVDMALSQRYDLEAARAEIDRADAEETLTWMAFLPDVTATFTQYLESEEAFSSQLDWTLGVNLEWTLFDGGGRVARAARARSMLRQRQLDLQRLEEQVRLEVEDAALAFRSLDRALFAFAARSRAATAAHDVTEALVAAGSATNLELLVARDTREEAARNLIRTTLGRKLAALRIRLAAGDMRSAPPAAELAD